MPDKTWKDLSGTLTLDAADWVGGVPNPGDNLLFPRISYDITGGLTALGGVSFANVIFGPEVRGKIGMAGTPVTLGAITGSIDINTVFAREMHLAPVSAADVIVRASHADKYAVHIVSGVITELIGDTEGAVLLGPAVDFAAAGRIQWNRGKLVIEPGVLMPAGADVEQGGGVIDNYTAIPGVVYGAGGAFNHLGDASPSAVGVDLGTVRAYNAWSADIRMVCAIAKIITQGGAVDFRHDARAKTVASAQALSGWIDARNGGTVQFTLAEEKGGRIYGVPNVKQIFPGGAAGGGMGGGMIG